MGLEIMTDLELFPKLILVSFEQHQKALLAKTGKTLNCGLYMYIYHEMRLTENFLKMRNFDYLHSI